MIFTYSKKTFLGNINHVLYNPYIILYNYIINIYIIHIIQPMFLGVSNGDIWTYSIEKLKTRPDFFVHWIRIIWGLRSTHPTPADGVAAQVLAFPIWLVQVRVSRQNYGTKEGIAGQSALGLRGEPQMADDWWHQRTTKSVSFDTVQFFEFMILLPGQKPIRTSENIVNTCKYHGLHKEWNCKIHSPPRSTSDPAGWFWPKQSVWFSLGATGHVMITDQIWSRNCIWHDCSTFLLS